MIVKSGKYRGDKVKYPDGVGVCIWEVLPDANGVVQDDDESAGLCFDFPEDAMPDIKNVLQGLEETEPKIYVPDEKYEEFTKKRETFKSTWYYKLWDVFDDVSIQIRPFDWQFRTWFITKEIYEAKQIMGTWVKGFHYGPIVVTW
jgi:hypothetical protein